MTGSVKLPPPRSAVSKSANLNPTFSSSPVPPGPVDRLSTLPLELLHIIAKHLIPLRSERKKANKSYRTDPAYLQAIVYHERHKEMYADQCLLNPHIPDYPYHPPQPFPELDRLRLLVRTSETMHVMLQGLLDYERDPLEYAIIRQDTPLAMRVLESMEITELKLLLLTRTEKAKGEWEKGKKNKTRGAVWSVMVKKGAAKRLGKEWVAMMRGELF